MQYAYYYKGNLVSLETVQRLFADGVVSADELLHGWTGQSGSQMISNYRTQDEINSWTGITGTYPRPEHNLAHQFPNHVAIPFKCPWCGTMVKPKDGECVKCGGYV